MYLVKFEEYRAFTAWYMSVQHVLVAAPGAKISVQTVAYWSGSGGVRRPTVKNVLYPVLSFMQERTDRSAFTSNQSTSVQSRGGIQCKKN